MSLNLNDEIFFEMMQQSDALQDCKKKERRIYLSNTSTDGAHAVTAMKRMGINTESKK